MRFKKLIIWLCALGLTILLGCSSVKDAVTPCYIPPTIIDSVNVDLPLIPWMPYTSLFDAKYVKTKMYYQYLLYNNLMTGSMGASEQFQQMIFSPTGPIGLLVAPAMAFGLGSFMVSKPEDKRKIVELEKKNGVPSDDK